MATIGETLKKLRFKKGMTQGDLADAININKASVSNYERGHRNPPYAVLCAMAEALDVQPDVLLACVMPEEGSAGDASKEDLVDSIRQRRIRRILAVFDRLSDEAQLTAIERIEELGMIPAYQRRLADTLQQYLYNRCRIKMEVTEEPPEELSYEKEVSDFRWQWKETHIILQHDRDEKNTLRWDFFYFSFDSWEACDEDSAVSILNMKRDYEEEYDRAVFVFDNEDIFNNLYNCYYDFYEGPRFELHPIPGSAWALFLLVDKETWAILQEQEYCPSEDY